VTPTDKEELLRRISDILDQDDVEVDVVSSRPSVRRPDGSFGPADVTSYEVYITAKKTHKRDTE
jgi:hypothetical protein